MKLKQHKLSEAEREVGDLLAVEAVDRSGVVVTRDGALVRILEVVPPNPYVMSQAERRRIADGFGALAGRLRPGQSLQFYIDARPLNLDDILERSREEVEAWAGPPPTADSPEIDARSLSRWRLYAAMEESLRLHSGDQAAMRTSAYVVVPYMPKQTGGAADLATELRKAMRRDGEPLAPLKRDLNAHRRSVRESLAHTDTVRLELDSLGLPNRLLNGEQVVSLLWSRFNPTSADLGRNPRPLGVEILGELDAVSDAAEAREAATRLRDLIARSGIDFTRSRHTVDIERDLEQTIYASTTAEHTHMGALVEMMLTRQPFNISVHVHALNRADERRRLKRGYRRTFVTNRTAESKGLPPDFDRYAQEQEVEAMLQEMSMSDSAGVYRVSIYQSLRARGPEPDVAALSEAVDFCVDRLESALDCRVQRGEFQQRELWESTLPLGRDVAARTRKYASRNVGDLVPLLGTSCGSPTGVPFAFSEPGRGLELLNPYDPMHANQVMLISGRSGSGKTMCANVILSRCIAHGARGFVIDRAGHYGVLTKVIDGAREVEIGADASEYAINPWDIENVDAPSREKIAFLVSLHTVMMGEEGLNSVARAQLSAAIRSVYARAAHTGEVPRESLLYEELLSREQLERAAGSTDVAQLLRQLAEQIQEFCGDGVYAYLLDRETNVPADAPLIVFETRRCPEGVLKPVMFSIVEYVTREVEAHGLAYRRRASEPDAPLFTGKSILLIDEAWAFVGNRETGMYANDLARRARHLGLFLIVMSQHLSDFETEHGLALLRNASQQMLLAQPPEELPFLQQALRLAPEEAAALERLRTVKGVSSQILWLNGARGRGEVSLRVGPTEYWVCTSDPIQDQPLRDRAMEEHGGDVWAGIRALADGSMTHTARV